MFIEPLLKKCNKAPLGAKCLAVILHFAPNGAISTANRWFYKHFVPIGTNKLCQLGYFLCVFAPWRE
jgi:hypothetical protein